MPSTLRAPTTAHFSMTPLTSRAPSTSMTPPLAPCVAAKPSSSSTTSTSRTSNIKCYRCHGVGHFQRDCPSKKSYITTDDGGYVSASDVEDDLALQTNNAVTLTMTVPRSLGVSIRRSISPKAMWCSGF
jgi:hypothetical protein